MENVGMYKELVENSDNIIIVTDPQYNIRYVSSAVEKTFDVEPASLVGKNVFDFVNSERINDWKDCLAEHHDSLSEEISLTTAGGKKAYFDVHVANLVDLDNVGGLAVELHDITEKKLKEYSLVKSNQQLDQMIYKTTHDLKAPLKSALGLVNLAAGASTDEKDEYINMIKKTLLKLDSFIDEMNDFFRNDKLALQREIIDIRTLLRDEIENLTNFRQADHIKVTLDVNGNTDFYSDAIRVKTIVTNILSNAIKYSDIKKSQPFIKIIVRLSEEFCDIRIDDNGIGIDQKYRDKIFDLFFRATDRSQGTGIGLFIVKDTIEKLKGTITVNSTLSQGTSFLIRIPNQIHQPVEA
jgi:PAS domain S-box-containing protein